MTILEMIAEWRRGCANGNPEECPECTRSLIDAIEKKERELLAPSLLLDAADPIDGSNARGRIYMERELQDLQRLLVVIGQAVAEGEIPQPRGKAVNDGFIDFEQDGVIRRICRLCEGIGTLGDEKHYSFCPLSKATRSALSILKDEEEEEP